MSEKNIIQIRCPESGDTVYIRLMPDGADESRADREMFDMARRMGIRVREVKNQNELCEKAVIFNAGLDDRVVEIAKSFVRESFLENCPDLEPMEIHLETEDGKAFWEILSADRQTYRAEADIGEIKKLEKEYASFLPGPADEPYVIDAAWAADFLDRMFG